METTTIPQGPVDVSVGPVAWAEFAENGNIRIWSTANEPVRKLAETEGMKLVPLYAIPEGWRLVPAEATRKMLDAAERVQEDGYHAMWDAMLATALLPPNA